MQTLRDFGGGRPAPVRATAGLAALLLWSLASSFSLAKVKIVYFNWFYDTTSNGIEKEIIRQFEALHPDIEVEKQAVAGADTVWEKATVMAAGGVAPDVIDVSLAVGLAARRSGLLLDLKPYIQRDNFDMRRFRPGYQLTLGPEWAWDGRVYGIPWGLGILNVFYNRDMFTAAGLAQPYKGWTTGEFLRAAARLTRDANGDGKPEVFGTHPPGVSYNFWPFIFGGDFADLTTGKLTVGNPEMIRTLEWLRDFQANYHVSDWAGGEPAFPGGKVAMTYQWDSYVGKLLQARPAFDWSVTWAPRGEPAETVSYGQGHVMGIMTGSKHPDAAWEFIKFYYSTAGQRQLAQNFLYPMTLEGMRAVNELVRFPAPLNKDDILRPYTDVGMLKTVAWWVPGLAEALNKGSGTFGQVVAGSLPIAQWVEQFKTETAAAASR